MPLMKGLGQADKRTEVHVQGNQACLTSCY